MKYPGKFSKITTEKQQLLSKSNPTWWNSPQLYWQQNNRNSIKKQWSKFKSNLLGQSRNYWKQHKTQKCWSEEKRTMVLAFPEQSLQQSQANWVIVDGENTQPHREIVNFTLDFLHSHCFRTKPSKRRKGGRINNRDQRLKVESLTTSHFLEHSTKNPDAERLLLISR